MAYDINELVVTNDETNKRIQDGIEKNRKGDFTLKTPFKPGEKVHVKLKNHKFRFGCNMFMLDEIPDDKHKNELYKEKLAALFNMSTVPFYWDATEPTEGHTRYDKNSEKMYRRPPADLCVEFCKKHGIEPREHALCYDHFFPAWLKGKSNEEVKAHLEKRMREISSRYADKIPTIEVTNEMFWNDGMVTDFYLAPDFMEWCYKKAAEYFPHNELCINEWTDAIWNTRAVAYDPYYMMIENLLLKGCRIDAIGAQYHMFHRAENYFAATRNFYNLPHLFNAMDNYARFKKPLEITEVTIPAYTAEEAVLRVVLARKRKTNRILEFSGRLRGVHHARQHGGRRKLFPRRLAPLRYERKTRLQAAVSSRQRSMDDGRNARSRQKRRSEIPRLLRRIRGNGRRKNVCGNAE